MFNTVFRGLVLPHTVVEDFGGERTDPGLLGQAIYFADAIRYNTSFTCFIMCMTLRGLFRHSTSLKYSNVSASSGTRHVIISDVALGKIHVTRKHQLKWTEPPPGCDSVHGARRNDNDESQFEVSSMSHEVCVVLISLIETVGDLKCV